MAKVVKRDESVIKVEATQDVADEPTEELYLNYQEEKGIVEVILSDGSKVVLRSPTTLKLMQVESWASLDPVNGGTSMLILKLIHVCLVKWGGRTGLDFEEMVDLIPVESLRVDLGRLAEAIGCFQHLLGGIGVGTAPGGSAGASV
jgi:hypothetical protein